MTYTERIERSETDETYKHHLSGYAFAPPDACRIHNSL